MPLQLSRAAAGALALTLSAPSFLAQETRPHEDGAASRPATAPASRPATWPAPGHAPAIRAALLWLQAHQDEDGAWDPVGFMRHDKEQPSSDGPGNATHKVGVTALALLAFLGDRRGNAVTPYQATIDNAVHWLIDQQDVTGRVGTDATHAFMYGHAIATTALCEAALAGHAQAEAPARKAVQFIQNARNPYKVWRYHPRDGDNDTSVTAWMVLALAAARRARLPVDGDVFKHVALWFDEVTDPRDGRCGYTRRGEGSSRLQEEVTRFPAAHTEAMTALGLLCRLELGQDQRLNPVLAAAAATLNGKPPAWGDDPASVDTYYWSFATLALRRLGGEPFGAWSQALDEALARRQRRDGAFKGSFDPAGAWCEQGGRVYQTALLALCLQARAGTLQVMRG